MGKTDPLESIIIIIIIIIISSSSSSSSSSSNLKTCNYLQVIGVS